MENDGWGYGGSAIGTSFSHSAWTLAKEIETAGDLSPEVSEAMKHFAELLQQRMTEEIDDAISRTLRGSSIKLDSAAQEEAKAIRMKLLRHYRFMEVIALRRKFLDYRRFYNPDTGFGDF